MALCYRKRRGTLSNSFIDLLVMPLLRHSSIDDEVNHFRPSFVSRIERRTRLALDSPMNALSSVRWAELGAYRSHVLM